jgi:hypothetical protein
MNFIDAIEICFTKYADFSGCASTPEFGGGFCSLVLRVWLYKRAATICLVPSASRRFYRALRSGRGGCTIPIEASGGSFYTFCRLLDRGA